MLSYCNYVFMLYSSGHQPVNRDRLVDLWGSPCSSRKPIENYIHNEICQCSVLQALLSISLVLISDGNNSAINNCVTALSLSLFTVLAWLRARDITLIGVYPPGVLFPRGTFVGVVWGEDPPRIRPGSAHRNSFDRLRTSSRRGGTSPIVSEPLVASLRWLDTVDAGYDVVRTRHNNK